MAVQIVERQGADIFQANTQALVNPVNTKGIMGKGLAKAFAEHYPELLAPYKAACASGECAIGRCFVFQAADKVIVNFPTKEHWRSKSRIEWIKAGLQDLVRLLNTGSIQSIAIPPLGCGLGGLDPQQVHALIVQELAQVTSPVTPITVELYWS